MPAARLRITGRVQGVSYRASARAVAQELAIEGWVRNEPDGSVTAWIQGPREALDPMIAWCREGPPRGRVIAVATQWVEEDDALRGFEVRRSQPR